MTLNAHNYIKSIKPKQKPIKPPFGRQANTNAQSVALSSKSKKSFLFMLGNRTGYEA